MASATIKVVSVCSGGDHAVVRIVHNAQTRDFNINIQDIRSAIDNEDLERFAKVSLKLLSEDKTVSQFKVTAQAGFTVTV